MAQPRPERAAAGPEPERAGRGPARMPIAYRVATGIATKCVDLPDLIRIKTECLPAV